ncbi:MAG TPA: ATPase [Clostridiales bacterium]|nr:ATPase [Clostridiales bacterium]
MYIVVAIALLIVLITIGCGVILMKSNESTDKKKIKRALRISLGSYITLIALFLFIMAPQVVFAQDTESSISGLGFIAAAVSTGLATIGAGYAVGAVGSSALGAVSEDPGILGKTLIFVGLAEGIAIYGLIVSIMILGRL